MIYGEKFHFRDLNEDGVVADFVLDEIGDIVAVTFLMLKDERLLTFAMGDLTTQSRTLH